MRYVLRIADTCLIHAQRLAEWCGHGPVLEEDIALTNMALDLVGQARALLTHAGRLEGQGYDEDQLAFLRDERQYFNLTLVEQPMRRSSAHAPGGDFADTVLRNFLLATWLKALWTRLAASSDARAGRDRRQGGEGGALPPAACRRLGRAAGRRHRRVGGTHAGRAGARLAVYARDVRARRRATRRPRPAAWARARDALRSAWQRRGGRRPRRGPARRARRHAVHEHRHAGRHSEHMGFILAEMQSLQRQYPGGRW